MDHRSNDFRSPLGSGSWLEAAFARTSPFENLDDLNEVRLTETMTCSRRLERIDQLEANIKDGLRWTHVVIDTLSRTRAILSASTLRFALVIADEASTELADEIRGLSDQLLAAANTTIERRPIFAGTALTPRAYNDDAAYLGDHYTVDRVISGGRMLVVACPGPEFLGTSNPVDPANGNCIEILRTVASELGQRNTRQLQRCAHIIEKRMTLVMAELERVADVQSTLAEQLEDLAYERAALVALGRSRGDNDRLRAGIETADVGLDTTMNVASRALSLPLLDFLG